MIEHFPSLEANWGAACDVLLAKLPSRTLHILEAGGGSRTNLAGLTNVEFTTIDISPEQIARNDYATHKIVGDLETYEAYPRLYDIVVVNDVLEHLKRPDAALTLLMRLLAPGGFIVIGGPVPTSFKGLFTKLTPYSVHVWFYRRIHGDAHAGEPGYAPFPTYLRLSMSPRPITARASKEGLEVMYIGLAKPAGIMERMRHYSTGLAAAYIVGMTALRALTFGLWRPDLTDMIVVLRRPF